jgi:hypothetical protein
MSCTTKGTIKVHIADTAGTANASPQFTCRQGSMDQKKLFGLDELPWFQLVETDTPGKTRSVKSHLMMSRLLFSILKQSDLLTEELEYPK